MTECQFVSDAIRLRDAFTQSMRRLATTVTIITTGDRENPLGMTATAVSSLSADPPSILACVNRSASIRDALPLGARFCINLLAESHHDLPLIFGGKTPPEKRFDSGNWGYDEAPYLTDAQANLLCVVDKLIDYTSHTIVIGKIAGVRLTDEARPLIFGNGRFIRAIADAAA